MSTYVVATRDGKTFNIDADWMAIESGSDFAAMTQGGARALVFYRDAPRQQQGVRMPMIAAFADWERCLMVDEDGERREQRRKVAATIDRIKGGDA